MSISIHTPRMGSDAEGCIIRVIALQISIHTPRMGSDPHVELTPA